MRKSEKNKYREITHRALVALALALVGHNHKWTNLERRLYEKSIKA